MASPAGLRAQETKAPAGPPLARYFPKDNLIVYFEFSGVNSHADAWNKTAAYKMLTETPLGEMLEEVGAQLIDKVLSYVPNRRLGGKELVELLKHAGQHGFAVGINANPSADPNKGAYLMTSIVFRGAAAKEARGLWSRFLGVFSMGGTAGLDKRQGRTIVVIPPAKAEGNNPKEGGRSWWAERDDVVLSIYYPWASDLVMSALDGKVPSAVDHPVVQELSRKDGSFEPVCVAFLEAEHMPRSPVEKSFPAAVRKLYDKGGVQRIAYRFGFDDDALMQEIRVVAPKPRKPYLALFDQPAFDAKSLIPLPSGIESFIQLSIDPNALIEAIDQLAPESKVKAKVDEFDEAIRSSGKIDFRKDFLGRIGPRMVLFLAPDKSAAVGTGSFETSWLQGLSPQAGVPTSLLSHNKLTLVAEVSDPKTFGRSLEGAINALNHLLERQTAELMAKEEEDKAEPGAGGAPAPGSRRSGGQRGTRKRSAANSSPHFVPMVNTGGAVAVGSTTLSDKQAYIWRTPSDSPLKIGPSNFHPVIKFESKYLVLSVAADSADEALKALKQKGWQPTEDVRKAAEHATPKVVLLGVSDPREIMPAMLASLPGTLQTIINTAITVARARAANAPQQGGGNPPPAGPGPGGPGGSAMMARRGGGPGMMPGGGPGMMPGGGPGMMPGGPMGMQRPGGSGSGGSNAAEIPADAMVELKVDSEKLPKADDLRSRYFLSTITVSTDDHEIRVATREAFLTHYDMIALGGFVAGALPAVQAAREAALKAQAAKEEAAAAQAPPGSAGMGRPGMPGMPGPGGPGMMPGGPGGRRGRGPGR